MMFERGKAKMAYEEHGQGRALLLLHGWGGRADSWLPVTRDFSKTRRVLVVDFPGHGQSPEPPETWGVAEYAGLLADFLESQGLAKCDLMAHSFGGRVALMLASTRPELVGKMLLTGCAGLIAEPSAGDRLKKGAYSLLKGASRLAGEKGGAFLRDKFALCFGSADYRALSPAMRETFKRVINQDLSDTLPKISSPTLLIWGENDTATPLWIGKTMEKQIPDAGLVVLPDTGHFAYLEKYADFRVIAERFFT